MSEGGDVEAPSATPAPVVTPSGVYPLRLPVLDEAELGRRTAAAQARTPGWQIVLDPFGLLSSARFESAALGPKMREMSAVDRERVADFLAKNEALVNVKAPNVHGPHAMTGGFDDHVFYMQTGAHGAIGYLNARRDAAGLTITGSLLPDVPETTFRQNADLEQALRRLDSREGLTVERVYRRTRSRTNQGPVEVRAAACLVNRSEPPVCVDAVSGENISAELVGTRISSRDGVVIERAITR